MLKEDIRKLAEGWLESAAENVIQASYALSPELVGQRMYEKPLLRFGSALDPMFEQLKDPAAIGPHFMAPRQWLPEARTVIAVFLPIAGPIRAGNRQDMSRPSPGWLHARIEGQKMISALSAQLREELIRAGYRAISPHLDERLLVNEGLQASSSIPAYSSNWSERHVAFACGLGTFGLSRGLITEKGTAGRYTSLVTDLELEPDPRPYSGLYDYCSSCGACARNCPAGAISLEQGKDQDKCAAFINETRQRFAPRYGCGKCQIKVPCESGAAKKRRPHGGSGQA